MIPGVFYIVLSDPLAGGTVTVKRVDRVEYFLYVRGSLLIAVIIHVDCISKYT
jgi:hypothetical protein